MPGLFLASLAGAGSAGQHSDLAASLNDRCHFDGYRRSLVREQDPWVGYTTYSGYPTRVFKRDGITCYFEGELYAGRTSDDELLSVAKTLLNPDAANDGVADWLTAVDGDFLLCAIDDERGDAALINDVFGRLPVYHASTDDGAVVAREPGFLLDTIEFSFDRLCIAEILLFGYALGERTLWNEIQKLPPASALLVRDGCLTVERLHEFDFDGKRHAGKSLTENADTLASLFTEACRDRGRGHGTNIVSLSGGHDSRAVAAAFHDADLPWTAATFARGTDGESRDVRVAREVAAALEVDWNRYELPPVRGAEVRKLLVIKSGLNHLGMSFILPFLEGLRDNHGSNVTYFTGDGGDKAVPNLSPPRGFGDFDALVDYTIEQNAVFSRAEAASVAGIDEAELRGEVRRVLNSYPESDFGNKYVHFLVHERGFNWLFEGEDRNRFFLWSTTPFYSIDFFEYAMNVPDEQKAKNGLYREFLSSLWAPSIEFADADFATPMASTRYDLVQFGLETLERYPRLASVAQTIYNGEIGSSYHENLSQLFRAQLGRCGQISSVLNENAVDTVTANRSDYGRHQVLNLATITSAIDHQGCGTPLSAFGEDLVFEE